MFDSVFSKIPLNYIIDFKNKVTINLFDAMFLKFLKWKLICVPSDTTFLLL